MIQENQPGEAPQSQPQQQGQTQDPVTPTPSAPEMYSDERVFSTLAYIPVVSVVTAPFAFYKHPKSSFTALHASQGLGLFGIWFISLFISAFSETIGAVLWMLLLVVSVYGGVNAWTSKMTELPFVKQLGEKILEFVKPFIFPESKSSANSEPAQTASPEAATTQAPVNTATPGVREEAKPVSEVHVPDSGEQAASSTQSTPEDLEEKKPDGQN